MKGDDDPIDLEETKRKPSPKTPRGQKQPVTNPIVSSSKRRKVSAPTRVQHFEDLIDINCNQSIRDLIDDTASRGLDVQEENDQLIPTRRAKEGPSSVLRNAVQQEEDTICVEMEKIASQYGVTSVSEDAMHYMSLAVQKWISSLIENMTILSKERNDSERLKAAITPDIRDNINIPHQCANPPDSTSKMITKEGPGMHFALFDTSYRELNLGRKDSTSKLITKEDLGRHFELFDTSYREINLGRKDSTSKLITKEDPGRHFTLDTSYREVNLWRDDSTSKGEQTKLKQFGELTTSYADPSTENLPVMPPPTSQGAVRDISESTEGTDFEFLDSQSLEDILDSQSLADLQRAVEELEMPEVSHSLTLADLREVHQTLEVSLYLTLADLRGALEREPHDQLRAYRELKQKEKLEQND